MPKSSTIRTEIGASLWGLAWWTWVATAIIWAAGLIGFSVELKKWPGDPVALWSADSHWFNPKWPMTEVLVREVEVRNYEGDAAYFSSARVWPDSQMTLGRWQSNSRSWSVCLWTLCTGEITKLTNQVTIASGHSRSMSWKICLQEGHFLAEEVSQSNTELHYRRTVKSNLTIPTNRWRQLVLVSDDNHFTLHENGINAGVYNEGFPYSPHLAEITLHPYGISSNSDAIALDQIMFFDRAIGADDVKLLFHAGRHGWENHLNLVKNHQRWLQLGASLAIALFLLASRTAVSWLTIRARDVAHVIRSPLYRPVLAVLLVGGVGTALIAWRLFQFAREDDDRYFSDQVTAFAEGSDSHFEKIAVTLERARDWIATQRSLSQESWNLWLLMNHIPHDIGDDLTGFGYAQKVLSRDLAAHEEYWSKIHRYQYRVYPSVTNTSRPLTASTNKAMDLVWILDGAPRLPVVLFNATPLENSVWETNETIIGRDLLTAEKSDPPSNSEADRLVSVITDNEITSSPVVETSPAIWTGHSRKGFRIYAPIANSRPEHDTNNLFQYVSIRRPDTWSGVVFANIDALAWLSYYYNQGSKPLLAMRAYCGSSDGDRHAPLVGSSELSPDAVWQSDAYKRTTVELKLYQYRIWLDICSTPAFEAHSKRRWPWIGGGMGCGFTGLAAALLCVQVRAREKQAAISDALRQSNEELAQIRRDREELSRNLHDGTIQSLYAVGLHLKYAQSHLPDRSGKTGQSLEEGHRLVQETIVELRDYLLSLKDYSGEQRTFDQIMEEFIGRLGRASPVEFEWIPAQALPRLPAATAVNLLNLVREAISNALRHAQPRHISVKLEYTAARRQIRLTVTDDGVGFSSEKHRNPGNGLTNMRLRAADLGGSCVFDSSPGHGTIVTIVVPAPSQT